MRTANTSKEAIPVVGQVWERDGREFRVVYSGDYCVNVRDVENNRFVSFSDPRVFLQTHRCLGTRMTEDELLFRVSDVVRRSMVGDAELIVDALFRLVRQRQVERAARERATG